MWHLAFLVEYDILEQLDMIYWLRFPVDVERTAHTWLPQKGGMSVEIHESQYQLIKDLVRRHKGMLQLRLLDSNERELHETIVVEDDELLALLQNETQLNIQWSIWDTVMKKEEDNMWLNEVHLQRVLAASKSAFTLVKWEMMSKLCYGYGVFKFNSS
ncbi:unnamed protein product [Aphanomyces euteiches]